MDQKALFLVSSLAGIFPPMTEGEYARLEESIREGGLLEEITLWRGAVIDGVHRLRACLRLGIEPRFSSLSDDADPLTHVIGKNGSRRSMANWQRPIAAFRASESSRVGRPRSSGENCANLRNFLTQDEAARTLPGQQALGDRSRKGVGPGEPGDTGAAEGSTSRGG